MKVKKALVVGGSNGIGLSVVNQLLERNYTQVYIVDRYQPDMEFDSRVKFIRLNLLLDDYNVFEQIQDINTLIFTAGFGRVTPFNNIEEAEIINSFKVNTLAAIRIIKMYYSSLSSKSDFYCLVMGSIAGLISSPLFAVYGATKAALCKFIESINVELHFSGSPNRILNVSPGSLMGTKFDNGKNDISLTTELAREMLDMMYARQEMFIPDFEKIYKDVMESYTKNPIEFGLNSYKYKQQSGRISASPQLKIGYLSGTFDLFHIGHLNLLRRAKEYCDYLVVGVHKDASHKNKKVYIPFEERVTIVKSITYVDMVIESYSEDDEAYNKVKYNYLFVGSDYKGTERFKRYEEYFKDKDVEIIYFPYTTGTSSTQLRTVIDTAVAQRPQSEVATSKE